MNGNANDFSGNSNHGSVSGATVASGLDSLCYSFDGAAYIANIYAPPPTLPYSLFLWAKPNVALLAGITNRKIPIVGPGPIWNPGIWVANDVIRVHANTEYRDYTISWGDLSWHFIGQIYDGTTCYIIYDGQVILGTRTGYSPTAPTQLYLGSETSGADGCNWNGLIQDVRIYNRALSADEVNILYELGNSNSKLKVSKNTTFVKGEFNELL